MAPRCYSSTVNTVPTARFIPSRTSTTKPRKYRAETITRAIRDDATQLLRQDDVFLKFVDENNQRTPPAVFKPIGTASIHMLRDSCSCPKCIDSSTKQKQFQTADIPSKLKVREYFLTGDVGTDLVHHFKWSNDIPGFDADHITSISHSWISEMLRFWPRLDATPFTPTLEHKTPSKLYWDSAEIGRSNKWLDYEQFLASEKTTLEGLKHLHVYGLLFLRGLPDDETAIERVTDRMGGLKNTFYGRTWDVRSVANAKNVAYTHQFLGLHMDLLYTTNPPHLQVLHSLRARAPGGASMFSDAHNAAMTMKVGSPSDRRKFDVLCQYPVTYHYRNDSQHYIFTRRTIEMSPSGSIQAINWSPPFQAPFQPKQDRVRVHNRNLPTFAEYVEAAKRFNQIIESEENLYEYRLQEGECVIFDNRRTLHARREFDAEKGERWLKGAYVDDDVYFSRMRVLQEKLGGLYMAEGSMREHT